MARLKDDMITSVGLDMTKATKSIKTMTSVVNASRSAWQAMDKQLRNTGDYVGAAQAKYEGLTKQVQQQREKVDALKDQQSKLNRNTAEGERAYQEYSVKINKATSQLSSYESQLVKADQQLDKQKSGLAGLQSAYRNQENVTQSYVEKLKAEGKTAQAAKTEYDGLGKGLKNLGSQQKIQQGQVEKLSKSIEDQKKAYSAQEDAVRRAANEHGKESKEYKEAKEQLNKLGHEIDQSENSYDKQRIALNKTDTAMAKTKTRQSELLHEMKKKPTGFLSGVRSKLKDTSEKTSKLHGLFGKIFSANVAANAFSNVWSGISTHIGDAVKTGNDYLVQQDKMSASWKTLTGSAKGSREVVKAVNDLADSAQNSAEMVNGLANQFYAVDKNKDKVINLSKATLTLQDAFGATDDAVQNFGKQWSQMMANGKVSAQDFMSFTNVFPALKPALLDYEKDVTHNSKLTMKQLNDMISKGKISSETMNKVLTDAAKKNSKATENFGKTIPGMTRTVQSSMPKLIGAIEKPFYKMKNPILGTVSKWATSSSTKKEFEGVGDALTLMVNEVLDVFGGKKFKAGDFLDGALFHIQNGIDTLTLTISKHKGDIREFFKNFKGASVDGIKIAGETLKDFSKIVSPLVKLMAAHPKVAGTFLAGFMVADKLAKPLLMIDNMAGSIGKLYKKVANSDGLKKGLSSAKDHLSSFGSGIKKAGKGIGKGLKWTAHIATKGAKKAFNGVKTLVVKSAKGIGKGLKWTAHIAVSGAKKAMTGLKTVAVKSMKGISTAFNFLKANPFILIVSAIAAAVTGLIALYKHNKKFRKFVNGIVASAKKVFSGVVKWFGKMKDGAIKKASQLKNGVVNHFRKLDKNTNGAVSSMWKTAKNTFKNGAKYNQDRTRLMKDLVTGHWGRLGRDTKNISRDMAKVIKGVFSGMYNVLNKLTGGGLGRLTRAFSNFGRGVKNIFSSIRNSIKRHIKNGINGAIGFLNGGIGGINTVIHTFGGSKHAIGRIRKLAKGGSGYHGIAMVNDGGGEEAILKGNQAYKVTGKNAYVNLEGDETVVPHEASRAMFGTSIKAYANGSKNWFSKITGWVKDKWDGLKNFIKHPIRALDDIMTKSLGKISGSELVTKLTPALGHGLVTGISSAVRKLLQKLKDKHDEDGGGGKGAPKGAGVQRWKGQVKDALKANGLSTSTAMVNKVLRQIATESGGNEKAVQGNIGDINNKTGDLAKGLMQTISATFNANAFKGHHNIFNGYDNLLAALHYAKNRYGKNLSALGNGHGYANGGLSTKEKIAHLSEGNLPEMVIPLAAMKRSRGYELLGQTVTRFAKEEMPQNSPHRRDEGVDKSRLDKIEQKFDMMISLLSQVVMDGKDRTKAIYETATDKTQVYKQQARDMGLADFQTH